MLITDKKLILASKSPRRQELLKGLDISFTVRAKETDESYPSETPHKEVAQYLSWKKAKDYLPSLKEDELLLTADTVVLVDGKILEKPADSEDAKRMLRQLSGKKHEVITGVTLADVHRSESFDDLTEVYFSELNEAELDYYVRQYRPFDKAGAYGVQEWIGYVAVYKMVGSFYNVMGLPVHKVYERLKNW